MHNTPTRKNAVDRSDYIIDLTLLDRTASQRATRERHTVLLVEDMRFFRQIVIEIISKHYDIITAADAKEALRLYSEAAPDIVFLDIDLPDMSGLQVLSAITTSDPQSFVVMLTASYDGKDVERAMSKGAKGYIIKPFTRKKIESYLKMFTQNT